MFLAASIEEVKEEKTEAKINYGIIQKFDSKRGYGFIECENGKKLSVFFHIKETNLPKSEIKVNLPVSFEMQISEKNGKNMAVNVSKYIEEQDEIKVISNGKFQTRFSRIYFAVKRMVWFVQMVRMELYNSSFLLLGLSCSSKGFAPFQP